MGKQVKLMHLHVYMRICVTAAKTCILQDSGSDNRAKSIGNICFVSYDNTNNPFNVQMSPASLSKFPEFHITPTLLPLRVMWEVDFNIV